MRDPLAAPPVGLGGLGVPRAAPAIPVAAVVLAAGAARARDRDLPRRARASPGRAGGRLPPAGDHPRARGRRQARPGNHRGPSSSRVERAVREQSSGRRAPGQGSRGASTGGWARVDRPSRFGLHVPDRAPSSTSGDSPGGPSGQGPSRSGSSRSSSDRAGSDRSSSGAGPSRSLVRNGYGRPSSGTAPAAPPGTPEPVVHQAAVVGIGRPGPAVSGTRAVRGPSRGQLPVTPGSGTLSSPRASTSPSWIA